MWGHGKRGNRKAKIASQKTKKKNDEGCLRYVEFFFETESRQYVENISLHNVDILQAFYNVENVSLQYVEKRKLIMGF